MFDAKRFGARLQQARMNAGYTGTQASTVIFTTQGSISRYENALVSPSIERVAELARLYGCSIDWLCGIGEDTDD